jgi:predicted nucleic acid-binding protein
MKNTVIDINIFMDFLFKRQGHENVVEIFKYCMRGSIKGFICAHEITTLYYFLEKAEKDKSKTKKVISRLMKRFTVIEINEELLNKALNSKIDDFEDAVIEVSAIDRNADFIITRNIKDFKGSVIPAKTPEELLSLLSLDYSTILRNL